MSSVDTKAILHGVDAEVYSIEELTVVHIYYSNSVSNRNKIYDNLDELYGVLRWKTKRSGPSDHNVKIGHMIVEIDN